MSQKINRRDFLKVLGAGAAATATIGCSGGGSNSIAEDSANGEVPKGQITQKRVAGVDQDITILGYGCMRWPTIPNTPKGENHLDQEAVNELVDYAMEHGVNYFDTAPMYCQGWSEETTGNALVRHPRDSYYIATKLSNKGDHSYDFALEMYHRSLKRLQTDHIDYYLLHNVGSSIEEFNSRFVDNGVLDYLMEERKAGRIRKLGWSFHGKAKVFDHILAQHDKYHWDFIQIQLNYSDWRHVNEKLGRNVNAEYLYKEIEKKQIAISVMEPLLGGRLSKVPDHVMERLKEREPNKSVASWAFRFAGSEPLVYTVLSGMTYLEHLQDNIRTYSPLVTLTDEESQFLDETAELLTTYPTIPCNNCDYCMPCPYGLDIPGTLLYYNKCVNEGNIAKSSQDANYREARRAYLIGYDRAVTKQRQAQHCIGCRKCVEHCPQSINIPAQMRRIEKYIEQLKQETL